MNKRNPGSSIKRYGKVFPTMHLSGPENMALDVILLEKIRKDLNLSFALRFYKWEGYWISIGRNQKGIPKNWLNLVNSKKIQIVRRPTGGNAVLHGGGLTYALIWSSPPRKKKEAYYLASNWLVNGFFNLGVPLKFGNQLCNPNKINCFGTSTLADLVDIDGNKRIGSAQLWREGHLMQHGEILLDPPKDLWMEIFNSKAPNPAALSIPRDGLDELLKKACMSSWPDILWKEEELNQEVTKEIQTRSLEYLLPPITFDDLSNQM